MITIRPLAVLLLGMLSLVESRHDPSSSSPSDAYRQGVLSHDSCTPDTIGRTKPVHVAIGLSRDAADSGATGPVDDYLLIAQAIRAHFVAPTAITLPLWARLWWPEGTTSDTTAARPSASLSRGLESRLLFRLRPNGRLSDSAILVHTAAPEMNAALRSAVRAADSSDDLGLPGIHLRNKDGWVRLRLIDWDHRAGPAVGLVGLIIPGVQADSDVRPLSMPAPDYPHFAGEPYPTGTVEFTYVVTAEGRVDPATFDVLSGSYREFVEAIRKAITRSVFRPAKLKGCPVPMLVRQTVRFMGARN